MYHLHYRKHILCQVLRTLLNAKSCALDKEYFVKCHSRRTMALDKDRLCRVQNTRHTKTLVKGGFVECPTLTRMRHSAKSCQQPSPVDSCRRHSTKKIFTECLPLTLGKVFFLLSQIFCGVFLQYIDLHVQF
jgi:hypothetical protein